MQSEVVSQVTQIILQKLKDLERFQVPVGISNRHVHLSQTDLDRLFGKDYTLTKRKDMKQPGQFAAEETVTLVGPKGQMNKVRILGPVRKESQVEISLTDGFRLGVHAPIRESGKLDNTPGLTLVGPKGRIDLPRGTIVALRHIHMTPEQASQMGVTDGELVEVETCGTRRSILGNVLVRVSDRYALEMHLDIDEANACALKNGDVVLLRKTNGSSSKKQG